ncbi:MAG: hypothetical protein IT287_03835 [Bdellovibrionaceae bacterium]|nr:hypothetical protein [Pseudobdellovibrionaceae bacterium]
MHNQNKMMFCWVILFCSLLAPVSSFAKTPKFKKVVWIVLENSNYKDVIKDQNFLDISNRGLLLKNMFAQTHPSQGNYVAMIAGSTYDIKSDVNVDLSGKHLGDLLENKNLSWRVYAEDYPGNCFLGATSGKYARKHVPFLSFKNVSTDKKRCGYIQNSSQFAIDFESDQLPHYSMYVPNLKNDGHDTSIQYAGKWLISTFSDIWDNPQAASDVLFIITFDESKSKSLNQIYTVLIHPEIAPGSINTQSLNHYSLLRFIEDELGLGTLGKEDDTAVLLGDIQLVPF